MNVIKIPVTIGRNRLRGMAEGAMIEDEPGEQNLGTLRSLISMEAKLQGIEPEPDWVTRSIRQVLDVYEQAYRDWQKEQGGCIGFIHEFAMPSGQVLLFGDRRILTRVSVIQEGDHAVSN